MHFAADAAAIKLVERMRAALVCDNQKTAKQLLHCPKIKQEIKILDDCVSYYFTIYTSVPLCACHGARFLVGVCLPFVGNGLVVIRIF